MTELLAPVASVLLAALAGFGLGALFFFGLHVTVQRALRSRVPAVWFLVSLVARTAVVLAGFLFVAADRWDRWLVCLVGFVLARHVVTRVTASSGEGEHATQP